MAATAQLKTAAELHSQLHALVIVDEPNDKLYALSGQLRLKQGPIPPSEAVREEGVAERVFEVREVTRKGFTVRKPAATAFPQAGG